MSIIEKDEQKDLIKYKKRYIGGIGVFTFFPFLLISLISLLTDVFSISNVLLLIYLIFFILFIIYMIFESSSERLSFFYINSSIAVFVILVCISYLIFFISNKFLFKWNSNNLWTFIFFIPVTLYINLKNEKKYWLKLTTSKNDILDLNKGLFHTMLEKDIINIKTELKGYVIIVIFTLVFVIYSLIINRVTLEPYLKDLYAVIVFLSFLGIFIFFFILGILIRYIFRVVLIKQWEHTNNKKLYTRLKLYIDRQDEINRWRSARGLKPVKIKSPFFLGRVDR